MGFWEFLAKNIAHSWETGHLLFFEIGAPIEILGILVGLYFRAKRLHKGGKVKGTKPKPHEGHELPKDHWWHHVEYWCYAGAVVLAAIVFLIHALFVTPFHKFKEESER